MKKLSTTIKRPTKKLLLVGAGHAHIGLLRRLANKRLDDLEDVEISIITEQPQTIYSGMLPGWMAGHYNLSDISIDITELCKRARVTLVQRPIIAVDANTQTVTTAQEEHFHYDLLSLNTGADTDMTWLKTDALADVALENTVIPVRPIFNFVAQWQQILEQAKQTSCYKVAVVGAGAAATELVMAAQFALQQINPNHQAYLVCGEHLLSSFDTGFRVRVIKQLQRHNIEIIYQRAQGLTNEELVTSAQTLAVDAVIAATGVMGSAWTNQTNLATVDGGFIAVNDKQQSTSHDNVFAVGDVATRADREMAHSGVHAVFGGKVAADNLLAYLASETLARYQPKNRTLYLLACGDKYAIGSWGSFSVEGRWVWWLKHYIDKRFVNSHK
ncbi:FAD-dependent oxidoreductase [Psychrobacter sp. 1U2]|uniref:FAD-dependent oxidoreductase n=1 Tax=Psychrobacter sp. 1U2 TaxID=3453577 RepID=UPI003F461F2A